MSGRGGSVSCSAGPAGLPGGGPRGGAAFAVVYGLTITFRGGEFEPSRVHVRLPARLGGEREAPSPQCRAWALGGASFGLAFGVGGFACRSGGRPAGIRALRLRVRAGVRVGVGPGVLPAGLVRGPARPRVRGSAPLVCWPSTARPCCSRCCWSGPVRGAGRRWAAGWAAPWRSNWCPSLHGNVFGWRAGVVFGTVGGVGCAFGYVFSLTTWGQWWSSPASGCR